jgi:hypothetical protein
MTARVRWRTFVLVAAAVALALAFFVGPVASSEPDGLERVALDEGFARAEEEHALADLPTADYAVEGIDDDGLGTGVAGVLGVAITFAAAGGLLALTRRSQRHHAGG